ncbi:MAG: hypothetical protein ACLFQX_09845 [Candidatus Kapaibacterium sp.]
MSNIRQRNAFGYNLTAERVAICRYSKRIAAFFIALLMASPAFAQTSDGGYAEAYLFRNVGARAISMAGAYSAIVNEPTAIFYNPAGVGFFGPEPMVSTGVSILSLGRTQSTIAWGQEVYDRIGLGFGINSFNSGSFEARDAMGHSYGEYSNWQYAISAVAAYRQEFASIGVGLKYLTNNLIGSQYYGDGFAIDVGTKFNVLDMFSVGVAVQNLSGMMMWNNPAESTEMIPYTVRAGVAMEYGLNDEVYTTRSTATGEIEQVYVPATRYVLVGIDAVLTQHEPAPTFVLGVEAAAHEMIVFRGGISLYGSKMGESQLFPMTYWGAGASIRPEIENLPFRMHLDYSVSNEYVSISGISHNLSLMFAF